MCTDINMFSQLSNLTGKSLRGEQLLRNYLFTPGPKENIFIYALTTKCDLEIGFHEPLIFINVFVNFILRYRFIVWINVINFIKLLKLCVQNITTNYDLVLYLSTCAVLTCSAVTIHICCCYLLYYGSKKIRNNLHSKFVTVFGCLDLLLDVGACGGGMGLFVIVWRPEGRRDQMQLVSIRHAELALDRDWLASTRFLFSPPRCSPHKANYKHHQTLMQTTCAGGKTGEKWKARFLRQGRVY